MRKFLYNFNYGAVIGFGTGVIVFEVLYLGSGFFR